MGSYLGKRGPQQPASGQEQPDRSSPSRPWGIHRLRQLYPFILAFLLRAFRRPSYRNGATVFSRFVRMRRRCSPIQQARYPSLGPLPAGSWKDRRRKAVLSACNSRMLCSLVTLRTPSPNGIQLCPPVPEQMVHSTLASPTSNALDPGAKKPAPNALKRRKKGTVEEEVPEQMSDSTLASPASNAPDPSVKKTPRSARKESKTRMVEKESQICVDGQENKRRRTDGSGSGRSALEPHGDPASFVPKPRSLKRGVTTQSSEGHLNKPSRTTVVSPLANTSTNDIPSSSHNTISSSCGSQGSLSQLWKRKGLASSSASSCFQSPERPAKKTRGVELHHQSSSSVPRVTDEESQGERVASATKGELRNWWASLHISGSSGKQNKKSLLLPSGRGDPLSVALPPQLDLPAPCASALSGLQAGISSDSKPTVNFLGLAAASSSAPVTDTKSPPAPQRAAKAEGTSTRTFKPIFGSKEPLTSVDLSTHLERTTASATAAASTASAFTGLAPATSTAASASTPTDSASHPEFGFEVKGPANTMCNATSNTTSISQSVVFGVPPACKAISSTATGSILQFRKPRALPTSATATSFDKMATSGVGHLPTSVKPSFEVTEGQQQGVTKPALDRSLGSCFALGNSAAPVPSAVPAPAQLPFGGSEKWIFGLRWSERHNLRLRSPYHRSIHLRAHRGKFFLEAGTTTGFWTTT